MSHPIHSHGGRSLGRLWTLNVVIIHLDNLNSFRRPQSGGILGNSFVLFGWNFTFNSWRVFFSFRIYSRHVRLDQHVCEEGEREGAVRAHRAGSGLRKFPFVHSHQVAIGFQSLATSFELGSRFKSSGHSAKSNNCGARFTFSKYEWRWKVFPLSLSLSLSLTQTQSLFLSLLSLPHVHKTLSKTSFSVSSSEVFVSLSPSLSEKSAPQPQLETKMVRGKTKKQLEVQAAKQPTHRLKASQLPRIGEQDWLKCFKKYNFVSPCRKILSEDGNNNVSAFS